MMKFKLLHFEINKILLFSLLGILLMCSVASAGFDYYNESGVTWVEFPEIPSGTTTYTYIESVGYTPNGANTFDVYENFDTMPEFITSDKVLYTNVAANLTIPTYDGSGQAVHPDVLYFADGWAGYEYWMVMTPYTGSNSAVENPSLVASHDGETWVVPNGITNPLIEKPVESLGHNADPDMIYNDDTDQLWVYHNRYNGTSITYTLLKINEDLTVEDPISLWVSPEDHDLRQRSLSVLKRGDSWQMWCQNVSSPSRVQYLVSSDGIAWSSPVPVTFNQDDSKYVGAIWHINVIYLDHLNKYLMLLNGASTSGSLYAAIGESPTEFVFYDAKLLKYSSGDAWDNSTIYRVSPVYNATSDVLSIYYSAMAVGDVWNTGLLSIDLSEMIDKLEATKRLSYKYGDPTVTITNGVLNVTGTGTGIANGVAFNGNYMLRTRASLNSNEIPMIGFSTVDPFAPTNFPDISNAAMTAIKRTGSHDEYYTMVGNDLSSAYVKSGVVADNGMHIFDLRRSPTQTISMIDDLTTWVNPQYANNKARYMWICSNGPAGVSVDWYFITENPDGITSLINEHTITIINSIGHPVYNYAIPLNIDTTKSTRFDYYSPAVYKGVKTEVAGGVYIPNRLIRGSDTPVDIWIVPELDQVNITVSTWSNTQKVWTLSSETQQSVTHTIGDLPANTDIQIKRDDINYETVTSNETGYIEWVYDGGFSEHTFSIEIEFHDFNASLTSGAYPLTTQFTTSSDGIDAYYWDFENDGIIDSTKQNPAHTYGQTGDYSVNLTVHTSEGNVSTVKPDYITVENPTFSEDPLAWFNWVFSYLFGRF